MKLLTQILATTILIPTLSMPSYAGRRRHQTYQEPPSSSSQQYEQRQLPQAPKTNNSPSYSAKLPLAPKQRIEQTQDSPNYNKETPHNYNQETQQQKPKEKPKPASFLEKVGTFIVLFGAFQKIAPLEKAFDIDMSYSIRKENSKESSKSKQGQGTNKPAQGYKK